MVVSKKSLLNLFQKWNVNLNVIPQKNEQWIEAFSSLGIEVESIQSNHLNPEDFAVVRVLDYVDHPDSDHMHICTVCDGVEVYKIVCGAKNVRVGMYTILAKLGAQLSNGLKIEKRMIRGVESNGMLCALGELFPAIKDYLNETDSVGIVDLEIQGNHHVPFHLTTGALNWNNYLMLDDDIFDLTIATNAGYLNALLPIAISLLAYWDIDYNLVKKPLIKTNIHPNHLFEDLGTLVFSEKNEDANYEMRMENAHNFLFANDKAQCYANWIMLYFGLPTLALSIKNFHYDQFQVKKLAVETNTELANKVSKTLPKDTIVIEENGELAAVPGFFVSENFLPAKEDEGFILLFSVNDWYLNNQLKKQININSYASYLSVKKDSFYFFNKYFNVLNPFLKQPRMFVNAATLTPSFKIACSKEQLFNKLTRDHTRLNTVKVLHQLILLGLIYEASSASFIVPGYRSDLENDNDLIEEALRFVNVNTLTPEPIEAFLTTNQNTYLYDTLNVLRNYLISLGFFETKTYKLTSVADFDNKHNPIYNSHKQVLMNPVSSERAVLKHTLSSSLREVIQYNLNQKNYLFENIFEIEQLYYNNNHDSDFVLGMLITKDLAVQNKFKVNSLKTNVVFELIQAIGYSICANQTLFNFTKLEDNADYLNLYAINIKDLMVGYCGVLKKPFTNNFLQENYPSYFVEMNLEKVIKLGNLVKNMAGIYHPIVKSPAISRDVNVTLAHDDKNAHFVLLQLKQALKKKITCFDELTLKDVFINESTKQKVLTLNYVLLPSNSLKKEEINVLEEQVSEIIAQYFN